MIVFAIYTLAGFLSFEFWQYVLKTKWFENDSTTRMLFSFGNGMLWASAIFMIWGNE